MVGNFSSQFRFNHRYQHFNFEFPSNLFKLKTLHVSIWLKVIKQKISTINESFMIFLINVKFNDEVEILRVL
jgi:hypothetical protein